MSSRPHARTQIRTRRQECGWHLPLSASTGGLYDSSFEHDACGVGFVADLSGRRSHDTVAKALTVLRNLEHRGAQGSDPDTGDGAGILTQIPDALLPRRVRLRAAAAGRYAAGLVFLPAGRGSRGARRSRRSSGSRPTRA